MSVRTSIGMLLALIVLMIPTTANAHVLLHDSQKQIGAILHVNPNDDPVAGKVSNLFFDIQGKPFEGKAYSAVLTVTNGTQKPVNAKVTIEKSSVSADYVFPSQGVYTLHLTVTTVEASYEFTYTQRVSRGVTTGAFDTPQYPWADMALTGSVVGLLFLLIVVYNRRREIASQSTW